MKTTSLLLITLSLAILCSAGDLKPSLLSTIASGDQSSLTDQLSHTSISPEDLRKYIAECTRQHQYHLIPAFLDLDHTMTQTARDQRKDALKSFTTTPFSEWDAGQFGWWFVFRMQGELGLGVIGPVFRMRKDGISGKDLFNEIDAFMNATPVEHQNKMTDSQWNKRVEIRDRFADSVFANTELGAKQRNGPVKRNELADIFVEALFDQYSRTVIANKAANTESRKSKEEL